MSDYYDGTKLLSLTDINGNRPELYLLTGNRTAGKTTYFARYLVNAFIKRGEQFMLLYRYNYELDNIPGKFFSDIRELFFPDYNMTAISRAKGVYHELYLAKAGEDPQLCGFATALNKADQIKKYAHVFNHVRRMMFDEFQPETGQYVADEVRKFQSIHTSVARGQGQHTRYVPVYMISNAVTLINPYFTRLKISGRLKADTKFLKGPGYVMEQSFNDAAAAAIKLSGFAQAFADDKYMEYATQNVYLHDSQAFIEKPAGMNKYLATIRYEGKDYAIRQYTDAGVIYCDDKPDMSFAYRIAVTTEDHQVNYVMLRTNEMFIATMRYFFNQGCFRFKNLECKDAVMQLLSY